MRARRRERFRVWTDRGSGSYGSRARAISAARWIAEGSGDPTVIENETTGAIWYVSAHGVATNRAHDRRQEDALDVNRAKTERPIGTLRRPMVTTVTGRKAALAALLLLPSRASAMEFDAHFDLATP